MSAALAERDLIALDSSRPWQFGEVVRWNPKTGTRHLDDLQWGLLPHVTADPRTAPRPTHARAENLTEKPMFADAFRRRRAIVPATEFLVRNTKGAKGARTWGLSRRDGKPLSMAGLWESYRWPDGRITRIVTVEANELVSPLHDRMPLTLDESDFNLWLGEISGIHSYLLTRSTPVALICRQKGRR